MVNLIWLVDFWPKLILAASKDTSRFKSDQK